MVSFEMSAWWEGQGVNQRPVVSIIRDLNVKVSLEDLYGDAVVVVVVVIRAIYI